MVLLRLWAVALAGGVMIGSVAANSLHRRACLADDCARAVTGTRRGDATLSAHINDCSSFFRYTVTSSTASGASTLATTTISPTAVPTYANACGGTERYSSVCSCASVSKTTTTVVNPSTPPYAQATGTAHHKAFYIVPSAVKGPSNLGIEYGTSTPYFLQDCVNLCDTNYLSCASFQYTKSTQFCRIYRYTPGTRSTRNDTVPADADETYGYRVTGS